MNAPHFDQSDLPLEWRDLEVEWGLVLGSGLGTIAERFAVPKTLSFGEVPGLPQSTVAGHAGQFLLLQMGATSILAAQGRVHLYEGHSARDVTAGIRFMGALGVKKLVLTNAAGSLNLQNAPGSWMMITDHLNLTGTSPLVGAPGFHDMSGVYSEELRKKFQRSADAENVALLEGVYAGLLGPQYETPAEVRMLRGLGADAVGMSTVLEAIQARALGMEVAGFSCLTNWAAGIGSSPLDHAEVLETGRHSAEQFFALLSRSLRL